MDNRVGEALLSDVWTSAEKWVIRWQFKQLGHFNAALADAISRADDDNLLRLASAYPDEVAGFLLWNRGDLAKRIQDAGLPL